MKLQQMFQKDINRDINGVIKVAQDDETSLKQELGEYIITRELRRHFSTFFDHYAKAIDHPTDKIGVWISGFFGSGKSHFLKMLSYLLANKAVGEQKAIDYFIPKFADPLMEATANKCVSVPTETILFNIDIEGLLPKDKSAVLRVFAKTFYNHCGFYGSDLKIAKLERFIAKQGKTESFHQTFAEINGTAWLDTRDSFAFFEDDVVATLQKVLGMSEQASRNWFNGEETNELSVAQLVADIKEYVDSKGKNFRLLFMVDEVGQYIGDDGDLMLNLQSLVEEIGSRCQGKVWVMVTSQEAIDSIVSIAGDDFSKIQGRFNTRLSLSSSSVDEVIKARILAKTDEAAQLLYLVYDKEHAVLKNLYTFSDTVLDIKGFSDAVEFAETFPFVPYQFIIIQKVLAEIRKHGNSGKHLSGGERSMLSGFQEAAQSIQDKNENALAPFYLFYDTVHTFLESAIRRVIDRAQKAADNHDGLEQQDVNVLKLLYLIRYIDDIQSTVDNIAILMIDDIRIDKITLRTTVKTSLNRLLSQNYIARNGDTYTFLTDEEQDVAAEINHTAVDSAKIIEQLAQIVYEDLYPNKKFKYGKYDFGYDRYIDETLHGSAVGGMRLRLVTSASDYAHAPEQRLLMDSQSNNETIVILSDESPYLEELVQSMKIRQYAKQRNVSQLPESLQDIIRKRMKEADALEKQVKNSLESAITGGKMIVHGEILTSKTTTAKDKLDDALHNLVESVYTKLKLITQFAESDADILAILNGAADKNAAFDSFGAHNEEALNDLSQWLELQNTTLLTVSMGDIQRRYSAIPYGWREIDIAALAARLIKQQKITIKYGGALVNADDRRLVDYLRRKSEIDKAVVTRRQVPSETLMRKSINFLRQYADAANLSANASEEELLRYVTETFTAKQNHYQELLGYYQTYAYPDKDLVTAAYDLMSDILNRRKDNIALLEHMLKRQDDLLDMNEDMEDVEFFFASQRVVYDNGTKKLAYFQKERDYFTANDTAQKTLATMQAILALPKPYSRIGELPELIAQLKTIYSDLLALKKTEVAETIRQCMEDVHQLAEEARNANTLRDQADHHFAAKREEAKQATSLMELDAMSMQLLNYKDSICRRMEEMTIQTYAAVSEPKPTAQEAPKPLKIAHVRRLDLCNVKRLKSKEDIDRYVEQIRQKLYQALAENDGVQIR